MDIQTFLGENHTWANGPALYIIKQDFPGNNVYRCGLAGGGLYTDADKPYTTANKGQSGLNGRLNMYKNFWLPNAGTIFAALRISAKLSGKLDSKIGGRIDMPYSISQGSRTLIRIREEDFHRELDRRNLRWDETKKNELFKTERVEELIACLRTVQSDLDMYLFTKGKPVIDNAYRGGNRRRATKTLELHQRKVARNTSVDYNEAKSPVELRLSKRR